MNTNKELKRCPFCNGLAGIYTDYSGYTIIQYNQCGCMTMKRAMSERAIKDWNRRIDSNVIKGE